MKKLADLERFGVKYIWLIDPESRIAYHYANGGLQRSVTDELAVPEMPVPLTLTGLFAEVDRI